MGQAGRHREGLRVFETVLVADRGLLAVRVIRSCQRLGIKAVSCVTEGDENALHTRVADEIIRLGVADPRSTEAVVEAVIEAARVSGAQAIHPGGGPWAADAAFAGAVLATDLAWVGAPPGVPAEWHAAWRETVRRGGCTLLWEASATEPSDVTAAGSRRLVGPDRLVEAVTRTDLVERQLRQAAGERPHDVPTGSGYAMQAALYAGPQTLVPVVVRGWAAPDGAGIVVDTVLADGARLTRYDDAVLARVTAHGADRGQALARLTATVDGIVLAEPPAELAELRALLREPSVISMVG